MKKNSLLVIILITFITISTQVFSQTKPKCAGHILLFIDTSGMIVEKAGQIYYATIALDTDGQVHNVAVTSNPGLSFYYSKPKAGSYCMRYLLCAIKLKDVIYNCVEVVKSK